MIVVVDDIPSNANVLARLLMRRGYTSKPIFCGHDLLEYLASEPTPRLVILDMTMPTMDGLECLRRLRLNPQWQNIPVIMYSAVTDSEVLQQAKKLGAQEWVVKTADGWDDLFSKIQQHAGRAN